SHVGHDEDAEQHDKADQVADGPAALQHEAGGDAEAFADQPGHAVEDEVAKEEADHHQAGSEDDVEQEAPALDGAAVQAIAADSHVRQHPQRHGDHRLAHEDDPAAYAGHPHHPWDHRKDVGGDESLDE